MAENETLSFRIGKKLSGIFLRGQSVEKSSKRGGLAFRNIPLPFNSYVQMTGQNSKTPLYRWNYSWFMDMYYGSDLLRTIIKNITDEVFKEGLTIEERFVRKCINPDCGYEVFEDRKTCPICGSDMRKPDLSQKIRLESFLKKKNRFNETTVEVAKDADLDINIFDNAFILLSRKYVYDSNGNIIGATIDDLVKLAPDKVKLNLSSYGMGRGDVGSYLYVCPEHRERLEIKSEKDTYYCPVDHKEMLECWFSTNPSGSAGSGASGQNLYFGKNELYHLKRWSSAAGYGVSPVYSVWRKVLTLIKMDDYTLEAYDLQRSPRGLLILRGKLDNIRQAYMWQMQKARENPNMIYPLVVEGEDTGARKLVEYTKFDLDPT
ncbi:MAG: hypothetical protein QXL94_08925, partial [Candidatus Parvarchaeum sp.]